MSGWGVLCVTDCMWPERWGRSSGRRRNHTSCKNKTKSQGLRVLAVRFPCGGSDVSTGTVPYSAAVVSSRCCFCELTQATNCTWRGSWPTSMWSMMEGLWMGELGLFFDCFNNQALSFCKKVVIAESQLHVLVCPIWSFLTVKDMTCAIPQ